MLQATKTSRPMAHFWRIKDNIRAVGLRAHCWRTLASAEGSKSWLSQHSHAILERGAAGARHCQRKEARSSLLDLEIAESGTRTVATAAMLARGEVGRSGRKSSGRSSAWRSGHLEVWHHRASLNTTETHPRPDEARLELCVLRHPGSQDLALHFI